MDVEAQCLSGPRPLWADTSAVAIDLSRLRGDGDYGKRAREQQCSAVRVGRAVAEVQTRQRLMPIMASATGGEHGNQGHPEDSSHLGRRNGSPIGSHDWP